MAVHHGKNGKVKLTTNAVAEVTGFSVNETVGVSDTTSMGDTALTHLTGIPGWTASIDGNYDPADTNGQAALTIVFLTVRPLQAATAALIGLSGAVALLYGLSRYRPARRWPWFLLASTLLLGTAGQLLFRLRPELANMVYDLQTVFNFKLFRDKEAALAGRWS